MKPILNLSSLKTAMVWVITLFSLSGLLHAKPSKESFETVYLWDQPDGLKEKAEQNIKNKITNIHHPSLTIFRPKKSNGVAVVICPGGGYQNLYIKKEGYDVANKLNQHGITAFVLKSRLPTTEGVDFKHPVPVSDALRAIQWVRHHAAEYDVNTKRIGIMGFSAGGHLAASASTFYNQYSFGDDEVSKVSDRPDFTCLGYAVISSKKEIAHSCVKHLLSDSGELKQLSCEDFVTADTPPAFIFHAKNDKVVKFQNAEVMHTALKKSGVASEIKLYQTGGHGFGLGNKKSDSFNWFNDFTSWLHSEKFIQLGE